MSKRRPVENYLWVDKKYNSILLSDVGVFKENEEEEKVFSQSGKFAVRRTQEFHMTVLFQKEKVRSVKAVKGEWGDWYLCDGVFREIFVDGIIDLTVYSKDRPWTGSG